MPRLLQRAWLRGFLPAGGGASEAPLTSLRSHLSAHISPLTGASGASNGECGGGAAGELRGGCDWTPACIYLTLGALDVARTVVRLFFCF